MNLSKRPAGFTLIEILLYVAIIIIIITGLVTFMWSVLYSSIKSEAQREVNYNLRLVAERISYEIRNADGLNYLNSTDVCLSSADPTYNPVQIYRIGATVFIAWGGGSTDCTGMTNTEKLTGNLVQVTDLVFVDNSAPGGESTNISFNLAIDASDGSTREDFQYSAEYSSSVEMRTIN